MGVRPAILPVSICSILERPTLMLLPNIKASGAQRPIVIASLVSCSDISYHSLNTTGLNTPSQHLSLSSAIRITIAPSKTTNTTGTLLLFLLVTELFLMLLCPHYDTMSLALIATSTADTMSPPTTTTYYCWFLL